MNIVIILLFPILFKWESEDPTVQGYYLYKGPSIVNMRKILTIMGGENKQVTYNMTDAEYRYFGVSSFSALGESEVCIFDKDGDPVVFGPPGKPKNLYGE